MIKNIITLCFILTISFSAIAEQWVLVDETVDGNTRLLIDIDSFSVDKNKNNIYVAGAGFSVYDQSGKQPSFYGALPIESCQKDNGEFIIGFGDSSTKRYWWSKFGSRLYDSAANAICFIMKSRFGSSEEKKNNSGSSNKSI